MPSPHEFYQRSPHGFYLRSPHGFRGTSTCTHVQSCIGSGWTTIALTGSGWGGGSYVTLNTTFGLMGDQPLDVPYACNADSYEIFRFRSYWGGGGTQVYAHLERFFTISTEMIYRLWIYNTVYSGGVFQGSRTLVRDFFESDLCDDPDGTIISFAGLPPGGEATSGASPPASPTSYGTIEISR